MSEKDSYEELKNADPEEILEALIYDLKRSYHGIVEPSIVEYLIRRGFMVAQRDGWEAVSPFIFRKYREDKTKNEASNTSGLLL